MLHDVDGFYRWLLERGRSEETAYQYRSLTRLCLEHQGGVTARLVTDSLSSSSKRQNLAALRAYARYTNDNDLLLKLDDMRLPPQEPERDLRPLSEGDWNALLDTVEQIRDDVVRSCLAMICLRGFRVGALPALTRAQVREGLRSGVLTFSSKRRAVRWSVKPFREHLLTLAEYGGKWKTVADQLSPRSKPRTRFRSARMRLQRRLKRAGNAAGLDASQLHPHRLRRTYAEAFHAETKDLVMLKDHMAWRNISTAARYVSHERRDELDAIADKVHRQRRQS